MKAAFLPSPASTTLHDPSPRPFSDNSSILSDYDNLPELAWPDDSLEPKRAAVQRIALKACAALVALLALSAAFLCWAGHSNSLLGTRIWNPNLPAEYHMEPLAKSIIRKFDAYNMARGGLDDGPTFDANVELYLAPDLIYDSVGFGTWQTPHGWARGEEHNYGMAFPETVFTQMLFFGDDKVATTTTYGTALWGGDLFGIKAPKVWVNLRITDFYSIRSEGPGKGRVSYNFMMIDWADALRQIGRRMLPKPPLEEGVVLPPSANDGVPAPLSAIVQAQGRDSAAARKVAEAALQQDWGSMGKAASSWQENMVYYGPAGIGRAKNVSAYKEHVLRPFQAAFPDREATVDLAACEGNYCGLFGRLRGRGVQEWLGLPVVGSEVSFRFAMHYRVVGGKVQEGWTIFDFPGLFSQLGLDFYALAAAGGRH